MGFRDLPSVDVLASRLQEAHGLAAPLATVVARDAVEAARAALAGSGRADAAELAEERARVLAARRPRRVVNATGVLLHTNLGRAPWSPDAAAAVAELAVRPHNLEFDLATGRRGGRLGYVAALAAALVDAEEGLVVNNNAAALGLAVAALAGPGGRVAVSRGELIEIGGSFRLPEVLGSVGVELVEVGTTNRTRPADYAEADVDVFLKVHPSNFRIVGFVEEATWSEVADVAARRGLPFVADVGSGLLDARVPWVSGPPPGWLAGEPGVRQVLHAGADVVVFSGDKLLGGPQAGIAVGTAPAIEALRRHPLARAFRYDGARAAALAATLEAYAAGRGHELPFWRMALADPELLRRRVEGLLPAAPAGSEIVPGRATPGAGSAPGEGIPGPVLRVAGDPEVWYRRLLDAEVPVVGAVREGGLHLDLRSVDPADDPLVRDALEA
ncbi:MAG TPA: L-seryl-tRNA(Sec) selenium transferase [Actinobacteria bacterium]|nr:L-seryl-tRNA(Sec) selenium transferase [Actinomycetota bacterium]